MKILLKMMIVLALFLGHKTATIIDTLDDKLERFENELKKKCIVIDEEEVYLVFDYSSIDDLKDEIFETENVEIKKESETSFLLVINRENEEIKERFYLAKGEAYEESN